LGGESRVDVIYIFTNIRKSVENVIFYGPFQNFYSKLFLAHCRIVLIRRTHKTRLLPFILRSVHSFTLL